MMTRDERAAAMEEFFRGVVASYRAERLREPAVIIVAVDGDSYSAARHEGSGVSAHMLAKVRAWSRNWGKS